LATIKEGHREQLAEHESDLKQLALGVHLNAAQLPWLALLGDAWECLAKYVGSDKSLSKGLRLLGESAPFSDYFHPEVNLYFSSGCLFWAFEHSTNVEKWYDESLEPHLYQVMSTNLLYESAEDVDEDDYVSPETEFELYFSSVRDTFLGAVDFEEWRLTIVDLIKSGPRNDEGQSCLDVINQIVPDWQTAEF
jgi:hypothetical protein